VVPEIIVVGTGRCGTLSVADMIDDAEHEPMREVTVPMVTYRNHRIWPDAAIAEQMRWAETGWGGGQEWPRVICDFKQSELLPVSVAVWPDVKVVWMWRNEEDTVRSMMGKGWYDPVEDVHAPDEIPYMRATWLTPGGVLYDVNYGWHRTRPDQLGIMDTAGWVLLSQEGRCRWWWRYCNLFIGNVLSQIDPDRWMMHQLGDDTDRLCDFLQVPYQALPKSNTS